MQKHIHGYTDAYLNYLYVFINTRIPYINNNKGVTFIHKL